VQLVDCSSMKYHDLSQIVDYLQRFRKIVNINRVQDNIIKVIFDKDSIYFDMSKSASTIYKKHHDGKTKEYNAPFDIMMQKRFRNSSILNISIDPNDRVVQIEVSSINKYKKTISSLYLEFTSKRTNAIIVENQIIKESLRHIDSRVSSREIRPNKRYVPIPNTGFIHKPTQKIEDVETFLFLNHTDKEQKELQSLKNSRVKSINQKLQKLQKLYKNLPSLQQLKEQSLEFSNHGNIVLANINSINIYQKSITIDDFDNNRVTITIPKNIKSTSHLIDYLFNSSKRLKAKANNLHIQKENISGKIEFYKRLIEIIHNTDSLDKIEVYAPSSKSKSRKDISENYATFYINGYKISIGRNSKENLNLLKEARANDMWFHIKDIPSSHLIVHTTKKKLPQEIVDRAAELLVDFVRVKGGDYIVDFTRRRDVKIVNGSNVNYFNYSSVVIASDI